VATNGTDAGSCTSSAPCRTINFAISRNTTLPGDIINVGPGRYGNLDGDEDLGGSGGAGNAPGEETPGGCACVIAVNKAITLVSRDGQRGRRGGHSLRRQRRTRRGHVPVDQTLPHDRVRDGQGESR
jgi:hypothetical protein